MAHIVKKIRERERVTVENYQRFFQMIGADEGSGFSFPCTAAGELIKDENYESWKENYEMCINNPEKYEDRGVEDFSWAYTEPAVAKCSCGSEVRLEDEYMGACECTCGQWYNMFGQALRNPEYWEEEY